MANLNDVLKDPDFWGPETTDDDRKFALSQVDKKFKDYAPAQQDIFLKNQARLKQEEDQRETQRKQAGLQVAQEGEAKQAPQSLFNKYIAQPLNNVVGQGMEALASPFVPIARMAQGESPSAAFTGNEATLGAGGVAKSSRESAASAVVPQEPWQAALYAAGPVAGRLGAAAPALSGVLGRVGTAAALGGLGELAGGDMEQSALSRTLKGAGKAGAVAAIPEAVAGVSGKLARMNITGGRGRVAEEDARQLARGIGELAPEYNVPTPRPGMPFQGKKSGEKLAQFFEGGQAQKISQQAWQREAAQMDADLLSRQTPTWIKDPELEAAYKVIAKAYNKPGLQVAQRVAPDPHMGFKPSQAAEVLALYRDALGVRSPNIKGHITQEGIDNLAAKVAAQLPPDIAQKFIALRANFAKQSAVRELMDKAFAGSSKGGQLKMEEVQKAIEDPELASRLGAGGKKLRDIVMRTKNAPFKSVDQPVNPGQYMPYPSAPGLGIFGARQVVHGGKYVGKPFTAPVGERGALRNLLTAGASKTSKKIKDINQRRQEEE